MWHHLSSDWLNWADQLAPAAQKINRHLIEALDLPALAQTAKDRELSVLDLASGVGEPAFGIARMLAGNADNGGNVGDAPLRGHVIASDIVSGMCAGLPGPRGLPIYRLWPRIWRNCRLGPVRLMRFRAGLG